MSTKEDSKPIDLPREMIATGGGVRLRVREGDIIGIRIPDGAQSNSVVSGVPVILFTREEVALFDGCQLTCKQGSGRSGPGVCDCRSPADCKLKDHPKFDKWREYNPAPVPLRKTIYLVIGETGEYSDRTDWYVRAYETERAAAACVERLTAWCDKRGVGENSGGHGYHERVRDEKPDDDPGFRTDYTGTWYSCVELELEYG